VLDLVLFFKATPDKNFKIVHAFLVKNRKVSATLSPLVDLVFDFLDGKTLQKPVKTLDIQPLKKYKFLQFFIPLIINKIDNLALIQTLPSDYYEFTVKSILNAKTLSLLLKSENPIMPYQHQIMEILNKLTIDEYWNIVSELIKVEKMPKKLLKFTEFLILQKIESVTALSYYFELSIKSH
jgi:hypothetical protein